MDNRDLIVVATKNIYPRIHHVIEEKTYFDINNWSELKDLISGYLAHEGFKVVIADTIILAVSRASFFLLPKRPVFFWINHTGQGILKIRIFDRHLQKILVGFEKERYRNYMRQLIEKIGGIVEPSAVADS